VGGGEVVFITWCVEFGGGERHRSTLYTIFEGEMRREGGKEERGRSGEMKCV